MSWKSDLLNKISNLEKQITAMGENGENTSDATMDFATTQAIENRAKMTAAEANGSVFRPIDEYTGKNETQAYMWQLRNYQLPTKNNFAIDYWWRMHRFVDSYYQLMKIWIKDLEYKQVVKDVFRYSFLWGKHGVIKETKQIISIIEEKDNKIIYCLPIYKPGQAFEDFGIIKPEGETLEIESDKVAILDLWFDNVGAYFKSIPLLGKYMVYKRMLETDLSLCRIILDTSNFGREKLNWTYDIENSKIKDKTLDNQELNTDALLNKVSWFVPPAEIETTYNILTKYIEQAKNEFHEYFGFPCSSAGEGKQTLSNELDNKKEQSINELKAITDKVNDFLKCLFNIKDETKQNDENSENVNSDEPKQEESENIDNKDEKQEEPKNIPEEPKEEQEEPKNDETEQVEATEAQPAQEPTPEMIDLTKPDEDLERLTDEPKADNVGNNNAVGEKENKELDGEYTSKKEGGDN